ncbi:MAG TPA: GDSL-type esterase/lipase family protein [Solirubrobacteraceae bacterium]|jgi:lysophospholipase L1-like esterase|nr:GDSL-type esterase/lipase family protein [Solirubrobacteraceae bacterium]
MEAASNSGEAATAGGRRRGLVAVGDSITNGEGQPMLGVRCQSWALWLASALELPYTGLAVNGAVAAQARDEQVPRLRGPYDVGCVYLGVNDVRNPGFELDPFVDALADVLDAVGRAAERVLVATVPLDLGRPAAPRERIEGCDAAIERLALERGAAVVDLRGVRGWTLVLPDAVHLTALGQLRVAELAARALGSGRDPADLADPHRSVRAHVRYALTTHAAAVGRDGRRRFAER